jgi:hypothetical protein
MRAILTAVSLLLLVAQLPASADDKASGPDKLVGTWRLVSWVMEDDVSKEQKPLYGEHPHGFATFTPAGRAFFLLTGEGRAVPRTDEERGAALRSMVAYTGRYRLEGDRFITAVDTAWNEVTATVAVQAVGAALHGPARLREVPGFRSEPRASTRTFCDKPFPRQPGLPGQREVLGWGS